MNPKLRALLAFVSIAVIGGTSYLIARPTAGVSRADLLDAGITTDCEAVTIQARVRDLCQNTLADGGLSRRYRTIRDVAFRCPNDAGDPVLIPRWTARPALRACFEPVGLEAIQILGSDFDDGGIAPEPATDECTCRERGKVCRLSSDGGLLNFAQTYVPLAGPFVGAGCTPTPCVVLDGEQDQGLAEVCR